MNCGIERNSENSLKMTGKSAIRKEKMKKLFSVIVPCHNSANYLMRCYRSIVEQTIGIENLQVIFIDDASEDETFALLCQLEQKYPDSIAVIRLEKNVKQGAARNIALQYVVGEYISFVDSDDAVSPDMYEKLAGIIKTYAPDIIKFSHAVVAGEGIVLREERLQYNEGVYVLDSIEARRKLLMTEMLDYGCWNKVYRTDCVVKAGVRFAEQLIYEEPQFTYPLYFYINSFYLTDDILYHYTFNVNGTMQKEMRTAGKLYDHVLVQAQTYEFIRETLDEKTLLDYKEEIEAYFVKTFFCETILFAEWGKLLLEEEILEQMRAWVTTNFPRYKENRYIERLFSEQHKNALMKME